MQDRPFVCCSSLPESVGFVQAMGMGSKAGGDFALDTEALAWNTALA